MSTTVIESRVHWVHTGIDAPHSFTIAGFNQLETGRGVAYSCDLVHPDLGPVGRIANEGSGGPTTFYPYDHARYSNRQLEQFLQSSLQDGQPMATQNLGMETLLDEIINEAENQQLVTDMRASHQFLIRSFRPRDTPTHSPDRGAPLAHSQILTQRDHREQLAAELAKNPAERLRGDAYWQMFTGEDWVRMLGPSPLTPEQITARKHRIEQLGADLDRRYHADVQFDDDFVLFGIPTARFYLVGDKVGTVHLGEWCRCRRRQKVVAFERWNRGSLMASGVVHAATRCRALVRID